MKYVTYWAALVHIINVKLKCIEINSWIDYETKKLYERRKEFAEKRLKKALENYEKNI